MSLTGAHITAALKAAGAGSGLVMSASDIADAFNSAMFKYGDGQFDTVNKVAALVSECMMESAYFRTTQEYSTSGRYKPYFGRTFIQITWESNYLKFGKWCKSVGLVSDENYFVDNPKKLADHKWAAIGGVWYFTKVLFHGKPLTEYANSSLQVGRAVNMGDPFSKNTPGGQSARDAAYKVVVKLGSSIVPAPPPVIGKKESIMATGTEVRLWNNENQSLKAGDQFVKIKKGSTDISIVAKASAGVDAVAVLEIDNPGGYALHAYWTIVDRASDGSAVTYERGISIPAIGVGRQVIQTTFKGDVPAPSKSGRSMRLRLIVQVSALWGDDSGQPVPPLPVINNVHIDGWSL